MAVEGLSSKWSSGWDRTHELPQWVTLLVLTAGVTLIAFVVIVLPIVVLQMLGRLLGKMIGG